MVGTLPKGFISKNHWGLDRKLTLMVSYLKSTILFVCKSRILKTYGIFLASRTKSVRWAKGQNLILRKDTLSESKVGHSDEASKCFDHDAIFQAEIRLTDFRALLMQQQASCGITTCLIQRVAFDRSYTICNLQCFFSTFLRMNLSIFWLWQYISFLIKPAWIPLFSFSSYSWCHTEKLSPHPQVPVILGLLKTNSEANFVST